MRVYFMARLGLVFTIFFGAIPAQATTLPEAQQALITQQYEQAISIAQDISGTYPVDAALIQARSYLELGQLDHAKHFANAAIQMVPNTAQPRVLLAMIHMREGHKRRANITLRRALDLAGSAQERAGISQLLRQLNKDIRFKLTGGVALMPSTNIAKTTSAETVTTLAIGGSGLTTEQYNPDQELKSGIGLNLWVGAAYVIPLSRDGQISYNFNQNWVRYSSSEFNSEVWNVGASVRFPLSSSGQSYTIGAKHTQNFDHEEQVYHSNMIYLNWRQPLDGRPSPISKRALNWNLSHEAVRRTDGRDFDLQNLGLTYQWPAKRNGFWHLGLSRTNRESAAVNLANAKTTLSGGRRYVFNQSGLILDINASLSRAKWDDIEPLFPEIRWENDTNASITVRRPATSFFGLTPYFRWSYLNRRSNQNIREVQSHDLFMGLSNAF